MQKPYYFPDELARKEATIRAEQLLGLEVLPSIYMLAILNMILMGTAAPTFLIKIHCTILTENMASGK